MSYSSVNNHTYQHLRSFIASRAGSTLLIVWSFLEANFWFVAPDLLLAIYSSLVPKKFIKFFLITILSSLVGGTIYYLILQVFSHELFKVLLATPFISINSLDKIQSIYSQHGYLGILFQSFSFIPFKVWSFVAHNQHLNPFAYFLLVTISRAIRLLASASIAAGIGSKIQNFLRSHIIIFLSTLTLAFFSLITLV